MIAKNETPRAGVWEKIAAPLPAGVIEWRQDGKPTQRDGKYFARFVSYISANTVRERLDGIVPGEWDLTLDLLPPRVTGDGEEDAACAFKARLSILGVHREDVGFGKDYKAAATDAFKRVAVRFGIGHELYEMGQNWVQVDGDGKYAKPLEDPTVAYARRHGKPAPASNGNGTADEPYAATLPKPQPQPRDGEGTAEPTPRDDDEGAACPKCGGRMWDNRAGKRNPKAPDFKCRDRSCDGVIWPPREKKEKSVPAGEREPEPEYSDDLPF